MVSSLSVKSRKSIVGNKQKPQKLSQTQPTFSPQPKKANLNQTNDTFTLSPLPVP